VGNVHAKVRIGSPEVAQASDGGMRITGNTYILSFRDGLSCSGERVVDGEMVGAEGWIGFHWGENMKRG
jgi:hypothetical protein